MDRRKGKRRDEEREGERRIQTERKKGRKKENICKNSLLTPSFLFLVIEIPSLIKEGNFTQEIYFLVSGEQKRAQIFFFYLLLLMQLSFKMIKYWHCIFCGGLNAVHCLLFFKLFFYFCIFGWAGWVFSSCGEQGLLCSWGAWVSHCGGFSYCRAWALGHAGFSSGGAQA